MEQTCGYGVLLLWRKMKNQFGLIKGIEGCIKDDRYPSYADYSISLILNQRVIQSAAGYEDANDCYALKNGVIWSV